MKKQIFAAFTLTAALAAFPLSGCGSSEQASAASNAEESSEEASSEETAADEEENAAEDGAKQDDVVETADGSESSGEQIVWKLAHTCADTTAVNEAALLLAERVSEATDGNFIIEVYPNSQLGGNREVLEAMQFGTIELDISNIGNLGGYSNKASALELPFLFEDVTNFDAASAVLNTDVIQPLIDDLAEQGFLWKGSWSQGSRHLTTSKTPVHTPEDMKGLKIRTMESEIHMAAFNAMGGNAVPMAFSEVFTALQQGAIDGQENPYLNIYTQGMHEVQGYIIETAHLFDVIPLLVSKSAYEALPTEYQQIFDEICEDMVLEEWAMADAQNQECKEKILESGKTEIIELTTEERQAFRDAVQPVYDEYADLIGADFIQSIIDAQEAVLNK